MARYCDICSRSEPELPVSAPDGAPFLQVDENGLCVCRDCRERTVTTPVDDLPVREIRDEVRLLVGKSAGAICSTLNLSYEQPYWEIIDAAYKIAYEEDRFMSAWSFVIQWPDGTTVWRDPDGDATAVVFPDGEVQIESR
jgi:hypothetical protein